MDQANGNARHTRRDAQRNLERVLAAAHALFAERGTDVTMDEVARRAGVGVGTIYRRFPSKEHLVAAVSHAACNQTRDYLIAAVASAPDPLQQLRMLVLVQYQHAADQAALFELRPAGDGACGGAAPEWQQQLYDTQHRLFRQVIAAGQQQGRLHAGDPDVLAALCLALVSPRAFEQLARVAGPGSADLAEHVVQFVLAGLGSRAG